MSVTDDVVVPATATALLFPAALILTTAVLSCLPGRVAAARCCAAAP
nr:transporter [Escherichia coli]